MSVDRDQSFELPQPEYLGMGDPSPEKEDTTHEPSCVGIDLREVLFGHAQRLSDIGRCSVIPVLRRESVAEHSYYVTLYAGLIWQWLLTEYAACRTERGFAFPSQEVVFWKALLHDLDESVTGDVDYVFKRVVLPDDTRESFERSAQRCGVSIIQSWGLGDAVSRILTEEYAGRMTMDDTYQENANRIVKFADFLSVLAFFGREIAMGNSMILSSRSEPFREYLQVFEEGAEYQFLQPLVREARAIAQEVFGWTK